MSAGRAADSGDPDQGPRIEVRVLGPLSVMRDGSVADVSSRRQRALLALLALNVGRAVPVERLIDELWDGAPPAQALVTLRSHVSNLRQVLGGRDGVLVTRGNGYALDLPAEAVDAVRLRRWVHQGRSRLEAGDAPAAFDAFTRALDLWQGDPLPEIADHSAVRGTVLQLTELRLAALEGQHEALLALGRPGDAVPGLEMLVADHPLREGPRGLLMLALYRAGRAADALEVHRAYRHLLLEEQGLDPGAGLDDLVRRILTRDPSLTPEVPAAPPPPAVPATPAEPLPGAALVGRTPELEHLRAHLARVVAGGPGALVLVSGEAGIGKSSLLDAVRAMAGARGVAVHAGRSPAAAGTPAFWPWTQVLGAVAEGMTDEQLASAGAGSAGRVGQVVPAIAHRAGTVEPVTGDDPARMRFLLYEAVRSFLGQSLRDRPAVLLLDDLHLADPPSLELLAHLTPSLPTLPVLVVASYRDAPADRSPALDAALAAVSREDCAHELALRGLSRDEVDSLAKQLSAGSAVRATPRDDFADLLFERTGGNPFLVRQLGRLLLEAGDPYAVPPGIRHVMSSRLAALTPPALRLLEGASVLGREFDLAVAASVSGMDLPAALDAYDEAARHGLVEAAPGTGHRFVHALFQEAVLAALPPGRSVRLHAAAGQQLELIGAPADLVAEHLWLARDLTGPAAVPHLVAAAESAAAMLAYEQAEHHLRRAAELLARSSPPDQQRELTVLLTLFTLVAATRGWGAADASALAQRARRLASTVGLRADALRLWWSLWLYFLGKGDFTTTGELALTLAEQVPDDGVSAAAAAAHLMSFFRHLARPGTEAQALRELEVAAGVVEKASATDLASYDLNVAAMVHLARAYVAAFGGDVEGQRAAARHAVTVADADGRPSARAMARTLAAQTAALAGAPVEEVRLLVDDARQVDDHYGYAYLSEQVSIFEVWVRAHAEGVTPEDVAALDSVVHRVVEKGVGGTEAIGLCLLGDVRTLAGDARGARQAYLEARAVPGANGQLMVAYLDRRLQA